MLNCFVLFSVLCAFSSWCKQPQLLLPFIFTVMMNKRKIKWEEFGKAAVEWGLQIKIWNFLKFLVSNSIHAYYFAVLCKVFYYEVTTWGYPVKGLAHLKDFLFFFNFLQNCSHLCHEGIFFCKAATKNYILLWCWREGISKSNCLNDLSFL